MSGRIWRAARAAAAGLLLAAAAGLPTAAATAPTFEAPTAVSTFGKGIVFADVFTSPVPLARVELLLDFPDSIGPYVIQVAGATAAGRREVTRTWSPTADGHLVPNTTLTARWRVVPADRSIAATEGPPVTLVYADTRFQWQTLTGDLVRLHWYEGGPSFGTRALEIGERAVRDAATFLGVTESEPIDFYVYADQAAFYDALGPGTRENVGGEAHADIRTMFALIGPADLADSWVGIVIPHELTHLVFDTAVRNPYHFPPRWLNEGLAVYLSQGYDASDRSSVEDAVRAERLMPLDALGGQFPTSLDRFSLAYAESVSAVDFLVRTEGTAALVSLIRSYADGVTDDEAFQAAIGRDLAGFEAAWLDDLGAAPPTRYGPQPAPAGPLPPGWTEASSSAAPDVLPSPLGSPAPSGVPATGNGGGDASSFSQGWVLALAAGAGLLVGGAIALVRRRRHGGDGGPAA